MLGRQVSNAQTADGYWDEAHRAHGPSPAYHRVHLHGLDFYYRNSRDEAITWRSTNPLNLRSAAPIPTARLLKRSTATPTVLRNFMASAAMRSLAIRRACTAAAQCDGISRSHRQPGRQASERVCDELVCVCRDRFPDRALATVSSKTARNKRCRRNATVIAIRLSSLEIRLLRATRRRKWGGAAPGGPWFAALSAIESDVPRFISNIYITERQSGFSVCHSEGGLLVGAQTCENA